jgi:hypothetical protein
LVEFAKKARESCALLWLFGICPSFRAVFNPSKHSQNSAKNSLWASFRVKICHLARPDGILARDSHESQIEPWLAIANRLLASAKEAAGRTRRNMTPRTSHGRRNENRALAKSVVAANRGWMSEEILPPADQVKCLFLTSPFIEPALLEIRIICNSDPDTHPN